LDNCLSTSKIFFRLFWTTSLVYRLPALWDVAVFLGLVPRGAKIMWVYKCQIQPRLQSRRNAKGFATTKNFKILNETPSRWAPDEKVADRRTQ
jgi:hypothetical protein